MGTFEHKAKLRKNGIVVTWSGLALFFFFFVSVWIGQGKNELISVVAPLALLAGLVLWLFGLALYLSSKGQSVVLCFLGIFPIGLFGGLIVLLLPDQYKLAPIPSENPDSNYPRSPGFH